MKILPAQALTSSSSTPNLRGGQGYLQILCRGKHVILLSLFCVFLFSWPGAKTSELVRQPEAQAQQHDVTVCINISPMRVSRVFFDL